MLPFFLAAALSFPWDLHLGKAQRKVVQADESFEAAGVSWSAASGVRPRLRVSADGVAWSDWITPAIDDDLTDPSSGRYFTAITHFGAQQRHIEVAFGGEVGRLTVTFFPLRVRESALLKTTGVGSIVSRVEWGCPDGQGSRGTPEYSKVTHAVVHHTAGANSVPDWAAEVLNIWYYHVMTNGWIDIGYNYLIDPNGIIYEGRAGGDGVVGAHFSCRNKNTVGIALLGTYSTMTPTAHALASLERLLGDICRRDAIDPTAVLLHPSSGLNLPTILGHRDGNVPGATCTITECPGDALYSLLPSIRSKLAEPPARRRRSVRQ